MLRWHGRKAPNPAQKNESWPVSRVLSWTVIYLGAALPRRSSNLPGNNASRANVPLFGLAPSGVYHAVRVTTSAVSSYLAGSPLPVLLRAIGGIFSVALSIASRRPVVNRHPALWSPDFPLAAAGRAGKPAFQPRRQRLPSQLSPPSIAIASGIPETFDKTPVNYYTKKTGVF